MRVPRDRRRSWHRGRFDRVAMKEYNVNVKMIMEAVRKSNLDVGARTIEFNRVEYLVRALGYIKSLEEL